jgi:hypothetical protein
MSITDPIRLIRNSLAFILYLPLRYLMPVTLILAGWKRSVIGTCTILVPEKQRETILNGIAYLRTLDPEMYRLLTVEHKYVISYHPKRFLQICSVVFISDNFLLWGKEGVAVFLVQCVFGFTIDYPSWKNTVSRGVRNRTRREIQLRLFEWISKQPFSPELINQYREFAAE